MRDRMLEICVQGITSALAAAAGGADRVELCENLPVGGVTPSAGLIATACRHLTLPVHVLIRPRAGDFVYTPHEQEAIRHDIHTAKSLDASGVVLGALTADGLIDSQLMRQLIDLARPMSVTFHRAFDLVPDPGHALETLIALGVDRVLTSGQAPTAREGLPRLRALLRQARGRIILLAAGSINVRDIHSMIAAGLTEIHVGSAAGPPGFTDPAAVRSLVDALRPTPPDS